MHNAAHRRGWAFVIHRENGIEMLCVVVNQHIRTNAFTDDAFVLSLLFVEITGVVNTVDTARKVGIDHLLRNRCQLIFAPASNDVDTCCAAKRRIAATAVSSGARAAHSSD